jgi:hypothetical protein
MPELRIASKRSAEMVEWIQAELLALEAGLPRISRRSASMSTKMSPGVPSA